MSILQKLEEFIQENELFNASDNLLLAVSGGIDSVVMLDLMYRLGYKIHIAHANFALRGQDSEDDEKFVADLAQKYHVPLFRTKFNTHKFIQENKLSVQLAARQLRYEWFENICKIHNLDFILTAHHLNDQIETIIYNLAKGTGISGLRGIRPKIGKVVRPLLFLSREDILEYAQLQNIQWREDISNESDKYSRNLIRHHVIPVLKQINPNLEYTIRQSAERILAVESWFDSEVNNLVIKTLRTDAHADYFNFSNLINAPQALIRLYHFLKKYNFNYAQCKEILLSLNGLNGKQFESATHILVKHQQELVITPKKVEDFEEIKIENIAQNIVWQISEELHGQLHVEIQEAQNFKIIKNSEIACLDFEKLRFPLTLRTWKEGDFFVPLGMKGKKKISDFLNDLKIPLNLKNQVLVLCSDEQIVWVVGYRIDDKFKVKKDTKKIYLVDYQIVEI